MQILSVEATWINGNDHELTFHLSDGNSYSVKAECFDFMTEEDRAEEERRASLQEEYDRKVEQERYRKRYYEKNGLLYVPKEIPEPF